MALEAANCLMVLVVFMSCVAFQVFCRLFDRLTKKGMALTSTRSSGERCVLTSAYGANDAGGLSCTTPFGPGGVVPYCETGRLGDSRLSSLVRSVGADRAH